LQVHLEQLGLVWRILLVGTDKFLFCSARRYFIPVVNLSHSEPLVL
jgi:hypothetical protein